MMEELGEEKFKMQAELLDKLAKKEIADGSF